MQRRRLGGLELSAVGLGCATMTNPGGRRAFRFGGGVEPFVIGAGSLRAGQTVEIITPGAGGYGSPT
jgi:N-methylhydantoinase B